ncbi:hypothetical protein ACJQ40_002298 [Enterococcus faecium]|nr:hypothetical protein [Enterococcus faecium]
MIDLSPLWTDLSKQALIGLAIVGIIVMIVAFATQGVGSAIGKIAGIIFLAALILLLGNITNVGTWLKNKIFNEKEMNAGVIIPLIKNTIYLHRWWL